MTWQEPTNYHLAANTTAASATTIATPVCLTLPSTLAAPVAVAKVGPADVGDSDVAVANGAVVSTAGIESVVVTALGSDGLKALELALGKAADGVAVVSSAGSTFASLGLRTLVR
jgi:hypothetical protein